MNNNKNIKENTKNYKYLLKSLIKTDNNKTAKNMQMKIFEKKNNNKPIIISNLFSHLFADLNQR